MSKLTRATQKVFASNAAADQIGVFGSLAAGTPTTTTNPETIQSLSKFLDGWFSAILLKNAPAVEDQNALDFLWSRQLAYLFQTGIAEWDAETTYYIGSFANNGTGVIYQSLLDDNINHALTDTTWWAKYVPSDTVVQAVTTYQALKSDTLITLNGAPFTVTLPTAASALGPIKFLKIDTSGARVYTIARSSSDTIVDYTTALTSAPVDILGEIVTFTPNPATNTWYVTRSSNSNVSVAANSATGSITSTMATVQWANVVGEDGMSIPSGIVTILSAGTYEIEGQVTVNSTTSASGDLIQAQILQGAATVLAYTNSYYTGAGQSPSCRVFARKRLAVGETIRLQAKSTAPSPTYNGDVGEYFYLRKVGE